MAAIGIGGVHQRLGSLGGIAVGGGDLQDVVVGHLIDEAVRAQDVAVTPVRLDPPGVHLDLGFDPEGPGHDVAARVGAGLGR